MMVGLLYFDMDLFVIVVFLLITVMRVMGLMSDGLLACIFGFFYMFYCVSVKKERKKAWSFHRITCIFPHGRLV